MFRTQGESMAGDDTRPGSPARYEERLRLKDGREVFLRPIRGDDQDLILDLFNRISPQSVYQRFLTHLHTLPEGLLHRLTHPNGPGEFALAGAADDGGKDVFVAVGRYSLEPRESIADLALAVRDDWQNLGLGKALLQRTVAVAREHGVTRFASMMDPRNTVMEGILKDLGYEVKYSLRSGFYQVEIAV
jgi:GNAT superfamily N-acetyltransferase